MESRANLLKQNADNIIHKIFYFGSRYEDAKEKYHAAKQLYKIIKNDKLVIECLLKEVECCIKLKDYTGLANAHYELAFLYSSIDKNKSVIYYEKLINYYTDNGDILKLAKIYQEIAHVYEQMNDFKLCADYLNRAGDIYFAENQKYEGVKCFDTLSLVLITLNDYEGAISILDIIIEKMSTEKTYFLPKYIFRFLITKLVLCVQSGIDDENMEAFREALLTLSNNYVVFDGTLEHKLLSNLINVILERNINEYQNLLRDYDYFKKLDNLQIKIFSEIKNKMIKKEVDLT